MIKKLPSSDVLEFDDNSPEHLFLMRKNKMINYFTIRHRLLIFVFITFFTPITLIYITNHKIQQSYILYPLSEEDDKLKCKFPQLNAWDSTILDYIKHPTPLVCSKFQPYLTFVDMNGILQFNQSELLHLIKIGYENITCYYRMFDRSPKSNSIEYDSKVKLTNETQMTKDIVEVKCSAVKKTTELKNFYFNLHAHPTVPKQGKFAKPNETQLSVLFVTIDSMSLSMMKRNMPLTYEYVTKQMGMIILKSFNKVGDNTIPNMAAALMGKRLFSEQDDMPGELNNELLNKNSDNLPLIWKKYSAKGYATVFNEDRPDIGLFGKTTLKDFEKKPFDYYYTPFYKSVQEDFTDRGLSFFTTFCFRNIPNGDLFVDVTKRHVVALKDYLQFLYSFFVYYSHEGDGIMIENADLTYQMFWKELFEGEYLNKTVIIFMGDHGQRFSDMRNTLVGLLEERNPFFGIWFPDWFYKLHPHIKSNLMLNSKRLATTFDIHETFKDILNANYNGNQRNQRGLSLLYPIPADRTCATAGIPRQYCLCFSQTSLNITLDYLQKPAEGLITTLNGLLSLFQQCHIITLDAVERAESIDFDEKVQLGERTYDFKKSKNKTVDRSVNRVRLAVKTQPNDAVFEAMMVKNETVQTWTVEGGIQRLTAYKNSSYCVADAVLKKYCTCKDTF